MPLTDPALVRRRLESAVAANTRPVLTSEHIDDLMTLAASLDETGGTIYTPEGLNRAASMGWQDKAGLVSDQFDLDADGTALDRSQMFRHCMEMAAGFADGTYSVIKPEPRARPKGMSSIPLTAPIAKEPTDA